MIETITPAVCGSRRRQRIALGAFALGALAASALVGGALGLLGAGLDRRATVPVAAALTALVALREAGLVRVPAPQLRFQVPERWRFELPVPVWAAGYGAGLGLGFATFQPFATFWAASAAAVALGRPLAGALAFSLFGVGRALMVVLPSRRERDPVAAVELLVRVRPALRRANVGVLAVAALLIAAAPAAAEPLFLGPGSHLDPSLSRGVLAYTERDGGATSVVVRVSGSESYAFPGARSPALDGDLLAYAEAEGVRVVRWRLGAEVTRLSGAAAPGLDWPWLAYRLHAYDGSKELWIGNLRSGEERLVTSVGPRGELGRPAVAAGRVAWHVATERGSRVGLYAIATGRRTLVAATRIGLLAHPALTSSRIAWVEQRSRFSYLRIRRLEGTRVSTLAASANRDEVFWTTALAGRTAIFTRWYVSAAYARLERVRFSSGLP